MTNEMSDTTYAETIDGLFYRPIRRKIKEVVKVDNDDTEVVRQELEEYVLTPQLEQHFSNAFETVIETERAQTEDIRIWISGFFGSFQSHSDIMPPIEELRSAVQELLDRDEDVEIRFR